jgi:maltooligosyltrehalose trehalohydrolase
MEQMDRGYWTTVVEGVEPECLYLYRLDGNVDRPDPASRYQPQGVHGPSQVVDPRFPWHNDSWQGLPLEDYVIYELHVGAFSGNGTFDAAIGHLDELADLGITAIELMPVAQFPGSRNWGYDGVYPYAVQNSYGGPAGLKRLIDACHHRGMAVILDVVYNHVGPEGNYLGDFGPYFTSRYSTPWGAAMNFDGPHSDEVRWFFIENALYWVAEFRVDALRLDALHAILDISAQPFIAELGVSVHEEAQCLHRNVYLIAESAANDARLVRPRDVGGYGLDAQWNEDFHHSLHALLTGERAGYYQDFGQLDHLVKAFREGFVYSGQYSAYCQRRHGSPSRDVPASRFVVFSQNHDQVGNRMLSDRLSQIVSFEKLKLAASVILLSPYLPLLFMGEEYGESAPFQYFVSHSDPDLIDAVRRGRTEEFAAFEWQTHPPDPQDETTFLRAKLNRDLRREPHHQALFQFYRELINLRRSLPALAHLDKETLEATGYEEERVLFVRRWCADDEVVIVFSLNEMPVSLTVPIPAGRWRRRLDSADTDWCGPGGVTPEEVHSRGSFALTLGPTAFSLLQRIQET